jgi:hypothetical protein
MENNIGRHALLMHGTLIKQPCPERKKVYCMEVFKKVKSGYSTFRSAKAGFDAACHPLQWVKDQMISSVKSALIAALTKSAGGPTARAMVERLDLEGKTYPLVLTIPLHAKLKDVVSNPAHVAFVQDVLNDVLAIPLEVWGYRLAEVSFECPDGESDFVVRAELGLKRLVATLPSPAEAAAAASARTPR